MRCPSCNHDNRPDRRFCTECGATLSMACPACGAAAEAGEKCCGGCGARLPSAAPAPGAPTPTPEADAAVPRASAASSPSSSATSSARRRSPSSSTRKRCATWWRSTRRPPAAPSSGGAAASRRRSSSSVSLGALGIQRTCRVTIRVLAWGAGGLACGGSRASAGEIGHFNPGMLGIRDYVMPDPGFYGGLYNLWYTTDQLNGANGHTIRSVTIPANHAPGRPSATLKLDVSVDLYALAPTFMWVSDWKPLGAKYAAYVVPTFANTSLGAAFANETERGINPSTSSVGVGALYVQP